MGVRVKPEEVDARNSNSQRAQRSPKIQSCSYCTLELFYDLLEKIAVLTFLTDEEAKPG